MPVTTWILAVVSGVVVVAIASGAIGREAHRLDSIAPRASYQLDEAVSFVADRIPPESQSRLTHNDVELILICHLRLMHRHGLQPDDVLDARQSDELDVRMSEDMLVATVLAEAAALDVELLDDVDAVHVVDAHLAYFDRIGALGGPVPLDDHL